MITEGTKLQHSIIDRVNTWTPTEGFDRQETIILLGRMLSSSVLESSK